MRGTPASDAAPGEEFPIRHGVTPIETVPLVVGEAPLSACAPSRRALWVGAAALVVGGAGEALLFTEATRLRGALVLACAMLLTVAAWAGMRDRPLMGRAIGRGWGRVAWRRRLVLRLLGIVGSAALGTWSVLAYMADPDAIFGLQGVLWLASMGLLLVSCARWYPRDDIAAPRPAWTRLERAAFAGIVSLSLLTHVAFLQDIPWRLHLDEGYAFTELMRYYRGPGMSVFSATWLDTSLPSLWFALTAPLMHIAGTSLAGVRLGPALAGALTVVPVYLLARLVWGRLAAVLAGYTVAVSAAYVHYSRTSIINVTTPFTWAICFYFLLKGLRSRRPGDFAWAGLAAGLSMYTYYATRLLPYLLIAFLAYLLVFHFRAFRERLAHFGLVVIGFGVGFGPLIGYFLQNPQMWPSRALSRLTVPLAVPTTWEGWVGDWNILAPLAGRNFLGLSVLSSGDTQYFGPLLLPLEALLVVLGAGLLIWRWRQPASFLVLLWGLSVIFTGGMLIDGGALPTFTSWTPAFPALYLALALPAALWLGALLSQPRRILRVAGGALLTASLVLALAANAYAYLVKYPPTVPGVLSWQAAQSRLIARMGPNIHLWKVGDSVWVLKTDTGEMMAGLGTPMDDMLNPSRELPVVGDPSRNLAFLLYEDTDAYLPLLQQYYPGGQVIEQHTSDGTALGRAYVVPAEKAMARYGVLVHFGDGSTGALLWSGQLPKVGALPQGVALSYPLVATWSGAFRIANNRNIRLALKGAEGAEIWINGQGSHYAADSVLTNRFTQVESGWVRFSVQARLERPGPVQLLVQPFGFDPKELGTPNLWPAPTGQGLAATLDGEQIVHRIDPFVGSGFRIAWPEYKADSLPLGTDAGGGAVIRWEGEALTASGTYTMELRTDGWAQLSIDGHTVVSRCAPSADPPPTQAGQVTLNAGWHKVRIDSQATGEKSGLEWFWTRPDGVKEVVPPSALRVGADVSPEKAVRWPDLPTGNICPGGQ